MDLTRAAWRKSSHSSANGGACVEVTTGWRKASYSTGNGGNCVEVATGWRKASYSTGNGGNCVEVASGSTGLVAVRDSKNPDCPALAFPPEAWQEFTGQVKAGQHNLA